MATDEKKLKEGIAYFEQILQVMPEDRSTLEFLCIAYEQTGEKEKCQKTLVSLAQVLVNERDFENAQVLLGKIENHDTPEIKAIELKLRAMLKPAADASAAKDVSAAGTTDGAFSRSAERIAAIKAERMLLTWLESNGVIEKELADKVGSDLQALGGVSDDLLISTLALIENENPAIAETASSCVADESKVPPIALEAFDQYLTLAKELPEKLVKVRGAVPFGKVADETLVAVANPMDAELRKEIAARFGGRCHFFFVPPLSLGIVLAKLFPESRK